METRSQLVIKAIKERRLIDYLCARGDFKGSPWDMQYHIEEALKVYYSDMNIAPKEKKYIEKAVIKLLFSKDEFEKQIAFSTCVSLNLTSCVKYLMRDLKRGIFEKFRFSGTKVDFVNAFIHFNTRVRISVHFPTVI